jgi:hypothetical protein
MTMQDRRETRVLVVSDHVEASPQLLDAIRRRAAHGPSQFRVVITNPARAEVHLLHPERHDKAAEAEQVLRTTLPLLEEVAGGPVIGSVSVRHDPMDAVEEVLLDEPVDEILVDIAGHGLTRRLHLDLVHRLQHRGLPVTDVPAVVPT